MSEPTKTPSRPRAVVAWSSGKDSAWALHTVLTQEQYEVVGLMTTVTDAFDRVAIHGTQARLLEAQAAATGLRLYRGDIPYPCPNEVYEEVMRTLNARLLADGVTHVVFGDLFLEDVRAYRDRMLAGTGLTPVYPLWGEPTDTLARRMVAGGLDAVVVSLDPRKLPQELAGKRFSEILDRLPEGVDPCGENGEFHTCVVAGPMFHAPLPVEVGEVVVRDGFCYADLSLTAETARA